MKKVLALLFCGFCLFGCEPLEDDAWVNNEVFKLNWTLANNETGRRPAVIDQCELFYYPQSYEDYTRLLFENVEDNGDVSVPTGRYDVLAISKSDFLQQTEFYQTVRLVYPTRYNENGDCVFASIPSEQIYAASLENVSVNEDVQNSRLFFLRRLLKKVTFIVNIFDYEELTQDVQFEISGLATERLISKGEITGDNEAILSCLLKKSGREGLTHLGCHTKYKGTSYILGTIGNNIAYVIFKDYQGRERKVALDLTSYLKEWNTEEVMVYINVDAPHNEGAIEKWDTVSSDIVFDE